VSVTYTSKIRGEDWTSIVLAEQQSELNELSRAYGEDAIAAARKRWHARDVEGTSQAIAAIREQHKAPPMTENESLIAGFRATIAALIGKHRAVTGARQVDLFVQAVSVDCLRYIDKLSGMAPSPEVAEAESKIRDMAERVIARVHREGHVEFSTSGD
jgi:hypothetical protein